MVKMNLKQSIEFLNNECGYIDVENDDSYTNKEIIKIAEGHFKDKECEKEFNNDCKCVLCMRGNPQDKIKFGVCPYCKGESFDQSLSEFQNECYSVAPYVVVDCWCHNCEKSWTEYYTQDEIKFDTEEEDFCFGNTLGKDDKAILLKAMNLLIESEGDSTDYTRLITILKGDLVNQG